MRLYVAPGSAWLVCPRLLELDPRHGQHSIKAPPCRRGHSCPIDHRHERLLVDPEGHLAVHFVWQAGSEHAQHHEQELTCTCGRQLVYGDLRDPWVAEWAEVEGEPHRIDG